MSADADVNARNSRWFKRISAGWSASLARDAS